MTTIKSNLGRDRGFAFTLAAFFLLLSLAAAYLVLSELTTGGSLTLHCDTSSRSSIFRSILIGGGASASLSDEPFEASTLFIDSAAVNFSSVTHIGIEVSEIDGFYFYDGSGVSPAFNLSITPSNESIPIGIGSSASIQISTHTYSYREELTLSSIEKGVSKTGLFVTIGFDYSIIDNGTVSAPRIIDVFVNGDKVNLSRTSFCGFTARFNIFPSSEIVELAAETESGIRIKCSVRL